MEPLKRLIKLVFSWVSLLSLAYAGSARADLLELISPIIVDSDNSIELQAIASLAIGLIFCGSCDQDAAESIT